MIVRAVAQWREPEILAPPWEIVHTVELPPGEFRKFKEDLLQAQPFIMEHANDLYVDNSGLTHGMLVLCEGIDDGILVNSEGFAYVLDERIESDEELTSVYVPGGLAYWPTGNAVAIFHAPERDMIDVPIIHFGKIDEGEEIFAEYDGQITIERYDKLETEE